MSSSSSSKNNPTSQSSYIAGSPELASKKQRAAEHSDSDEELSEEEESKGEWSIGSGFHNEETTLEEEEENHLEKPRQRILTSNRHWLIAVVAMYTASAYLDGLIAHDVNGYGPDEPIWHQTTFPVFFETAEVPTYNLKGEVISTTPIPLMPDWKMLMENELVEASGVSSYDFELTLKLIQPAVVPVISGVVDVQQTGIMQCSIRFFKPYYWGSPSANQSLTQLLEKSGNPGSKMFTRSANPKAEDRGQPAKLDTFNMNLGSPMRGRINERSGQQEPWLTQGRADGRPPSYAWLQLFGGLQLFGMVTMGISSLLISSFAWDAQVQEHGDVRLSVKQDDPHADLYRMKWPAWTIILAAMFRLEALPELMESLKSKKEYWSLIALLMVGLVVQIIPSFLLQLHLAHGCGAGPSLGIVLSFMVKSGAFCGIMVLWERSNAFTATNVALKLSWEAHTSLTWQRVALWRFSGLMSRLLPLAVLMTMYTEVAALYVAGLDMILLFFMVLHTAVRQNCTLGNERCTCCNFFYFYVTRLPSLLFFYNDSYTGRSYDNSIIHPLLYLCMRGLSLGVITYYWWYAQVIVWGSGGAIGLNHGVNTTVNYTQHEARAWLQIADNGTFPDAMITDDPLSGFPTMVAGGIFFLIYVRTFVDTWKRAGIYYNLPPGRRRGLCFCWMCVVDTCFRRLCGWCGGIDAIPPPPPKSKFAGHKMDAVAIEDARPKASLMLKRLRANAGTRTGASYNKYRMRSDEEMESIMSSGEQSNYTDDNASGGGDNMSEGDDGNDGGESGDEGMESLSQVDEGDEEEED